jgi:hypothetical protein
MNVCVRRTYIGRSFIHSLIDGWGGGGIVCQGSSKVRIISSISIYQWWQQLCLYNNLLWPTVVVVMVIVSIHPWSLSFKCKLIIFSYNKPFSPMLVFPSFAQWNDSQVCACVHALDMYPIITHADRQYPSPSCPITTTRCRHLASSWSSK